MPALRTLMMVGLCLGASAAGAQTPPASDFDTLVSNYVAEGLRSNLALQGQTLEVDKASQALSEARSRFFPQLSFEARYTRAEGGRVIDVPLGTALNPVYSTLNELLVAQGQPERFPQISDTSIPFLRKEEQDTRLMLRQPLYAPAIPAAVRAQRALLDASSFNRMAIARALRRDITVSYVDWLKARSSVEIVAASEALLQENLRVNESLFGNGKITEDLVLRAKAELLDVEQQKREAQNLATQAQSYFNFLLNRQLQTSIEPSAPPVNSAAADAALEQLWSMALDRRPEIAQVEHLRSASEEQVRIARQQKWPTLSLGVDAGTQGEEYRFGEGYNFGTASLIFTWRIFDGGGDTARVHQARSAEKQLVLRQEEIAQQIRLEVQQSYDRLATARDSLATAAARAEAARAAFRIASRKRDEGVISQVEFIDARSALTSAELNHNLTRFNVLARRAELEYATSTGDLPLDPGV
ncbi:TolC family protein [Steroidobacter sp.]|uniref:TolC family protein n=1 Tax=Steroidobacter sp. TaxID=1978227 RepID=UPI001A372AE1|nr:TolC family protein [Steroidobacter sp.]MBL8269546.1 TolC family protein [Steroidobacter sp.]